jgi:hypothetical protein
MVRKTIAGILSALVLIGAGESTAPRDADLEQMLVSAIQEEVTSGKKEEKKDDWTIKWGRIYSVDEEAISYLVTDKDGKTYSQSLCFELCSIHYSDTKEEFHWARMALPGPHLVNEGTIFECPYMPTINRFLSYHDLVKNYGAEGVEYRTQKGGILVDGIMLLDVPE